MLKDRIKNKEKLIGSYIELCDPTIARILALAGYDFIWVDTEHSPMTSETLLEHVRTLRLSGTPAIVRVPQGELTFTKKTLEMGIDGIIFPMVKTPDEINDLIASTLYPPHGTRGFGPMDAVDYGFGAPFEYTKSSVDTLCRFIQIEHREAIENLDKILENPYIDGYIFGPNDLAGSYNMLGEHLSNKISEVIKAAIEKIHKAGKYAAIASGGMSEELISHWSRLGADMLIAGADFDFLRTAAVENRKNLERIHKAK